MSELIVEFPASPIVSKKRKVAFAEICIVHTILSTSEKDNKMMWYSSRDYKVMRAANKQAIIDASKKMRTMRSINDIAKPQEATGDELEACCAMIGIENMLTLTAIKKTRARRVQQMTLVLQEQDRQVRAGVSVPNRLALVAQHCSRSAAIRAHTSGMRLHSL